MKRGRNDDVKKPPWGSGLPMEITMHALAYLDPADTEAASRVCRAWRTAACALVTHLCLPLNHPLLLAGPPPEVSAAAGAAGAGAGAAAGLGGGVAGGAAAMGPGPRSKLRRLGSGGGGGGGGGGDGGDSVQARQEAEDSDGDGEEAGTSANGLGPGGGTSAAAASRRRGASGSGRGTEDGRAGGGSGAGARAGGAASREQLQPPLWGAAASTPDRRLAVAFPFLTHITLVHNSMLHRRQVHAALSAVRALWPGVRGLSVHDSCTWDLPLDYAALGAMTHLTSLELLFQGQGGMDEAGQPLYRASMPYLCRLGQLRELCMKWIIGYDVDSFLDFAEVYDLLGALAASGRLASLQFGGENINALGAAHLAGITSLETLHLVCDARPASPLHLLDLLCLPRLRRLELLHVCPDHAWNRPPEGGGPQPPDLAQELEKRLPGLSRSPLRCLSLSLSPRCQDMMAAALPLLPHLHSLSVRVTSAEEEEALCRAFSSMVAGPPPPPPPADHEGGAPGPGAGPRAGPGPGGPGGVAGAAGPGLLAGAGRGTPSSPYRSGSAAGSPATPMRGGGGGLGGGAAGGTPPGTCRATPLPSPPPRPPPLRSLRLETAELSAELVAALGSLSSLTSLQLPRGLPSGDLVRIDPGAAAAAAAGPEEAAAAAAEPGRSKFAMPQLAALGRLTGLRRLLLQMDSPSDTSPAYVDGSLVSTLTQLSALESLHLSTWNLLQVEPSAEALGAYPERPGAGSAAAGPSGAGPSGAGAGPSQAPPGALMFGAPTHADAQTQTHMHPELSDGAAAAALHRGSGASGSGAGSGMAEEEDGEEVVGRRRPTEAEVEEDAAAAEWARGALEDAPGGSGAASQGGRSAAAAAAAEAEAAAAQGLGGADASSSASGGSASASAGGSAATATGPAASAAGAAATAAAGAAGSLAALAPAAHAAAAGAAAGGAAPGGAAAPVPWLWQGPGPAPGQGAAHAPGPHAPPPGVIMLQVEPAGAAAAAAAAAAVASFAAAVASATAAAAAMAAAAARASLPPLPVWAWPNLRSLSLTHWPCVFAKLREVGLPRPGRAYSVCWDDLPRGLTSLLLVRCELLGGAPPPGLWHLWLSDCIYTDCELPKVLARTPQLRVLVVRSPSLTTAEPPDGAEPQPPAAARREERQREALLAAVTALKVRRRKWGGASAVAQDLRTLGLGGLQCGDVAALAALTRLRHLMLEPAQPPRQPGSEAPSHRDLGLLDALMALPPGGLAGLRTLWLPNWAMPIKQLLQWQQMLQAAMPLVVVRITEYDVVWTVPTPLMHVAQVQPPSSLQRGRRGRSDASAEEAAEAARGGATRHGGRDCGASASGAGAGGEEEESTEVRDGQELEWWNIGCWGVQ
ncbi:hypothetical protein HXX76_011945 [Chlamydomonas incerta]|uniref:F-box domain-containing protein n=1 Tax=Chlamydomonas incerta TaxID=51695 RepID=A0A835SIV8_CHLIN|nr:hypothetical protein HXX76_011945 [Chlamydomonas incerta]|eukprot:KAG2427958.1 hypothetical protein HXX76_011945 [Chlamydomonas incerta]